MIDLPVVGPRAGINVVRPRPSVDASRVRAMREARGVTQAQLARELGVTGSMVSRLEAGVRRPSRELLRVLADWFDTDPDDLGASLGVMPADLQERLSRDPEAVKEVRRILMIEEKVS
jgi:transcriptional regulator with XRE-family HTH domain